MLCLTESTALSYPALYTFMSSCIHTLLLPSLKVFVDVQDRGAPKFWDHNTNMWQPFSLSSFCLALLLVHRTTTTYNRYLTMQYSSNSSLWLQEACDFAHISVPSLKISDNSPLIDLAQAIRHLACSTQQGIIFLEMTCEHATMEYECNKGQITYLGTRSERQSFKFLEHKFRLDNCLRLETYLADETSVCVPVQKVHYLTRKPIYQASGEYLNLFSMQKCGGKGGPHGELSWIWLEIWCENVRVLGDSRGKKERFWKWWPAA